MDDMDRQLRQASFMSYASTDQQPPPTTTAQQQPQPTIRMSDQISRLVGGQDSVGWMELKVTVPQPASRMSDQISRLVTGQDWIGGTPRRTVVAAAPVPVNEDGEEVQEEDENKRRQQEDRVVEMLQRASEMRERREMRGMRTIQLPPVGAQEMLDRDIDIPAILASTLPGRARVPVDLLRVALTGQSEAPLVADRADSPPLVQGTADDTMREDDSEAKIHALTSELSQLNQQIETERSARTVDAKETEQTVAKMIEEAVQNAQIIANGRVVLLERELDAMRKRYEPDVEPHYHKPLLAGTVGEAFGLTIARLAMERDRYKDDSEIHQQTVNATTTLAVSERAKCKARIDELTAQLNCPQGKRADEKQAP